MAEGRLQLALPFPRQGSFDPRDFLPAAANRDALTWLDRTVDWPDRRLALWGQPGCGKSHLLSIWATRTGAARLSGPLLCHLDDLPDSGGVAVDDADAATPDATLLHLLNIARDRGLFVLLGGVTPPARWPARLPDLASRLRSILPVEIQPPDDELLRALLMRLLADRQLAVPLAVQEWLLRHLPRSPGALRAAVGRLDRASMEAGRPITRPMAAALLADLTQASDDGREDEVSAGLV